ncbi:MAG: hypothetical protein R3331_00210 [Sulfurospirillaceae bacterium]|nr:hypothetical protein [Sulfurospirillaceae bacterium]
MKYIFFIIAGIIFLNGCSYKHDNLYIGSKKTTEQAVANTKKVQILKDKKPIIFATITYLDSIKNKKFVDKNMEQFVIGFHFRNSGTKSKNNLDLKDVNFQIDGKTEGISVIKLNSDSPILKIIPASTPWSQYFFVQTSRIPKNIIKFSFQIHPYAWESLDFEKDF